MVRLSFAYSGKRCLLAGAGCVLDWREACNLVAAITHLRFDLIVQADQLPHAALPIQ